MLTHKGTKTIETERLILRKVIISDAESIFLHLDSDEMLRWNPNKSVEQTQSELVGRVKEYNRTDFYEWGIELKKIEQIIGAVAAFKFNDTVLSCEIGAHLSRRYRGQGIMTEAQIAVNDFLFSEVGINRIEANHDVDNPAAGKVLEKAGLKFEGIQRQNYPRKDGSLGDLKIYSILKSDWLVMNNCLGK